MDIFGVYKKLLKIYGSQGWWPLLINNRMTYGVHYSRLEKYGNNFRDPYFEIAIGAILTQNTAWTNAAEAIKNLYQTRALTPQKILKKFLLIAALPLFLAKQTGKKIFGESFPKLPRLFRGFRYSQISFIYNNRSRCSAALPHGLPRAD